MPVHFRHASASLADAAQWLRCTLLRLLPIAALGLIAVPCHAGIALLNASHASTGTYHTCVIVNGGAQCWGANERGELGDGSYIDSATPVLVRGLGSGVVAIAAGAFQTCAIVSGGAVKCWGDNGSGELGDGTTTSSPVPVTVQGLAGPAVAISSGQAHTCVVLQGGTLQCWGFNGNGQLGNGSLASTLTGAPVSVSGITAATAVSAGADHTCAIVGGGVQCWGFNGDGELNNGTVSDSHVPVATGLTSGVTAIVTGWYHSCAVLSTATVRCWGSNSAGQLGNNSTTSSGAGAAVAVSNISAGATALAAGGYHTCAAVNGAAQCWGYNFYGQLGTGTFSDSHVPVAVNGLGAGVSALAAGFFSSCAHVTVAGVNHTQCWGDNVNGQAGTGDAVYQTSPQAVTGLGSGGSALASGTTASHSCAIVAGAAQCWGDNDDGQLGNNSYRLSSTPVAVSGLASGVSMIATGAYFSCAAVGGAARCWGKNDVGQLGNGSSASSALPVVAIASGVNAIAAGLQHACAIVGTAVKCWGRNDFGELGNGQTVASSVPVTVSGLSGVPIALSAGALHTCVILQSGQIQCWGYNGQGQLGNGSTISTLTATAVMVSGIASGATLLSAGGYHTCALVAAAVKCWGYGEAGALGNGLLASSSVPVAVSGLGSAVTTLGSTGGLSCAIHGGAVSCWGSYYQPAGLGAAAVLPIATAISGLGSGVTALGGGAAHLCAIVAGAARCIGADAFGQIGVARNMYFDTAQLVVQAERLFHASFD